MNRHWVVDSSPIILLTKAGHSDLLLACTEELLIPRAVSEEVHRGPKDDPAREWLEAHGKRFVDSTKPIVPEVAAWDLGRGESRVLSFGFRNEEWTAVVDDGTARRCAQGLDISVVGTLGILVVAKKEGHLDEVRPATRALRRAGLYVSEAVIDRVLRMAGES